MKVSSRGNDVKDLNLAGQGQDLIDWAAREMPVLGQLHLQLALEGAGALGEDVEDETGAIQHAAGQELLQVAFLAGAERVVHQHQIGLERLDALAHLGGLAFADEVAWFGGAAAAGDGGEHLGAGGARQLGELRQQHFTVIGTEIEMDEDRALAALGALKHAWSRALSAQW